MKESMTVTITEMAMMMMTMESMTVKEVFHGKIS